MPCYTESWWGPGRHSPRRVTSLYVLKEAEVCDSAPLVTVQLQASPTILCLVRQIPAAPSALPWSCLVWSSPPADFMVCTPVSLTHSRPLWTSSLHGGLSFLHPCSLLSLNAPRNFLCDIISSPSYDVLASVIFASSPVSFIFSQLPPLVRARVLSDTGASRVGSHLPYGMSHTLDGSLLPFRKGMAINLPLLCKVS